MHLPDDPAYCPFCAQPYPQPAISAHNGVAAWVCRCSRCEAVYILKTNFRDDAPEPAAS